jgi:glycopeptide antibiotics resistance protein
MGLSVLVILVCTLYPFRFDPTAVQGLRQILGSFTMRSGRTDLVANVFLFMPLGLGLAGWLWTHKIHPLLQLVLVAISSALLSGAVECAQAFLPSRFPSYMDVVTNTLGGVGGYLCFYAAGSWLFGAIAGFVQNLQRWLDQWRSRYVWMGYLGYLTLTLVLLMAICRTSLGNWDVDLPLRLGGKHPEQSPWEGAITAVQWRDRALTSAEVDEWERNPQWQAEGLVADYGLSHAQDLGDRSGGSPSLAWSSPPSLDPLPGTAGVAISPEHWLQTPTGLAKMSQGIQRSSQFSLSATITAAPEVRENLWYHQILTLGNTDYRENLVIGQFGPHLVIGVQTMMNPVNPGSYQIFVRDALSDSQSHRLILTYTGLTIKVYLDGQLVQRSSLVQEVYTIVGGLLIFAPLSFLLSLIANSGRMTTMRRQILLGAGMILPPLLLEGCFADLGDRPVSLATLLLTLLIMVGTFAIFRDRPLANTSAKAV